MQIIFSIDNNQSERVIKNPVAYLEGSLLIKDEEKVLFKEKNILLIEFASVLNKWLNSEQKQNFIYETMDSQESPIIAFIEVDNDFFKFKSVWSIDGDGHILSKTELIKASGLFIEHLEKKLKEVGIENSGLL